MAGELLITAGPGEWRAAWIEDGEAVELYVERGDTKLAGSQHLGRVVRVVPALDAAFVDIGDERPGFLPLRAVAEGVTAQEGARLTVEVRREAWQDKAPRLIAKVGDAWFRKRALGLDPPAQLFPPPGFAAALALRAPDPPFAVTVDDSGIIVSLRAAFPDAEIAQRPLSEWPIDLETVFEAALSPSVSLGPNGTVHIEETRTATVIDVDTGTPRTGSSERTALTANLLAARLIATELRLRNIGGAVVIDFVGLDRRSHREQVGQALEAALVPDPLKPQFLGWTRLGHLEVMRPRRGRSLADAMLEPGSRAKQGVAIAHEAMRRLLREARANPSANWRLAVPPAAEAALRGAAFRALQKVEDRLGRRITIETGPEGDGFDVQPL